MIHNKVGAGRGLCPVIDKGKGRWEGHLKISNKSLMESR